MDEVVKKLKIDDDLLIPNFGDVRHVKQKGKIRLKDGVTNEVEIDFERKRNAQGGVDVIAHVHKPLGMASLNKT